MAQLWMLTVPGLEVTADWRGVHDRLLDDFGEVDDVLATTMPETLLIIYDGDADIDGWLEVVSEAILSRRLRAGCYAQDDARLPTNTRGTVAPLHRFDLTTTTREKDLA